LNRSPKPGSSLLLELELPLPAGGTMPAIGAVAAVTLPDERRLVGHVDGGSGHSGKRSPQVHLGLGSLGSTGDAELPVEVAWRGLDGKVHRQTLRLAPGRHRVVLGQTAREEG
jgi:hypothetical protein